MVRTPLFGHYKLVFRGTLIKFQNFISHIYYISFGRWRREGWDARLQPPALTVFGLFQQSSIVIFHGYEWCSKASFTFSKSSSGYLWLVTLKENLNMSILRHSAALTVITLGLESFNERPFLLWENHFSNMSFSHVVAVVMLQPLLSQLAPCSLQWSPTLTNSGQMAEVPPFKRNVCLADLVYHGIITQ